MKDLINLEPNAFNNRNFTWANRAGGDIYKYIQSRAVREYSIPDQLD